MTRDDALTDALWDVLGNDAVTRDLPAREVGRLIRAIVDAYVCRKITERRD